MDILNQINEFFRQYFGMGLIGGIIFAGRQFWKLYQEIKKRNDQLDELLKGQVELDSRLDIIEEQGNLRQEASLASLHDRIYSAYEIILKRGSVTMKELNNMSHLWKAYSGLGGNGTGKTMYERICAMPVIEKEEE
ncbi:hypothetical protein [Enterococcus asini]|uniref:hypothetical protein n=1 Tax=Enterococcus asini TaxID=57732 RepID=UPI0022E94B1F|nr:hypothetical protein [Enterococcus asini]